MLSNTIKQKRKEKAGKWEVPLPKVRIVLLGGRGGRGRGPQAGRLAGGAQHALHARAAPRPLLSRRRLFGACIPPPAVVCCSCRCQPAAQRSSLSHPLTSSPPCSHLLPLAAPAQAQVRPVAEDEMFKVLRTGKRKKKEWKRMVTKVRLVRGGWGGRGLRIERRCSAGAALGSLGKGRRAWHTAGARSAPIPESGARDDSNE